MPRGCGALLTTNVETVDLGEHAGRHLRGKVRRRVLRLRARRAYNLNIEVGRSCVTAVEVAEPGRDPYLVTVRAVPDPMLQLAQRLVLLVLASWLVGRARAAAARHIQS